MAIRNDRQLCIALQETMASACTVRDALVNVDAALAYMSRRGTAIGDALSHPAIQAMIARTYELMNGLAPDLDRRRNTEALSREAQAWFHRHPGREELPPELWLPILQQPHPAERRDVHDR